ncbi:MAG TPA: hypothetical protein VH988_33600 [Thermoanaerobaculia bacterium]|jgi:uncharacterized delta-60 repeat protein|nr:hypothetical protein [Thermoanaerobaculia bacterium]
MPIRASFLLSMALLLICSALTGPLLAADGALDPSFNGSGKLNTVFNPASPVNADLAFKVLVQTDQKIVVVGWVSDITDPADIGVVRYNPNGTVDTTFGNHGFTRVGFGFLSADEAFAAARQADGKILIGGFTGAFGGSPAFALVRLRTDGTPDPAFGSGGMVQTDLGGDDWILALKVQSDGKILAAGMTGSPASHDFALVRYNPNGTLDNTFGTGGKVITDFTGRDDRPAAIAVQSDGKILVGGLSAPTAAPTSSPQMALARYTPAGRLDTTFGTGGKLLLTLGVKSGATAIAVLAGGKILVGGGIFQANGHGNDFLLVRLNPTGTLDKTFGTGGKTVTDFGGGTAGNTDDIAAIAVLTNGKILAAGEVKATTTGSGNGQFGIARYTANGQLDTTFGSAGKVTTQFGSKGSRCTSVAVQANGRIVAAGHVFSTNPAQAASFGVARYLATLPAVQEPGLDPLDE